MAITRFGDKLFGLFSDTKPTTNVLTNTRFLETDTQIEYYWNGTAWSIINLPDGKKVGWWEAVSSGAAFVGLLSGNLATTTISGTQARTIDTNGMYSNWPTGATSGNVSGTSTGTMTARTLNPVFIVKYRLNTGVHCRLIAGFTTVSALAIGSDMLNAQSGVLWYYDDVAGGFGSGNNWRVLHNDGSGASVNDDTTVQADGNIHTVVIVGDSTNTRFSWSLDGGAFTHITTDIPASTTALRLVWSIETEENVAKNADWFRVLIVSDK